MGSSVELVDGFSFSLVGKLLFQMTFSIFDDSVRDTHDNNNARLHLRWNICDIHFYIIEFWKTCIDLDPCVYVIGKESHFVQILFSTYFFSAVAGSDTNYREISSDLKTHVLNFLMFVATVPDTGNKEEIEKLVSLLCMYSDVDIVIDITKRLFAILVCKLKQTQQALLELDGLKSLFALIDICLSRRKLSSGSRRMEDPLDSVLFCVLCILKAYQYENDQCSRQIFNMKDYLDILFKVLSSRTVNVETQLFNYCQRLVLDLAATDYEHSLDESSSNSFFILQTYLNLTADSEKGEGDELALYQAAIMNGLQTLIDRAKTGLKLKVALVDMGIFLKSVNLLVACYPCGRDSRVELSRSVLNLFAVLLNDSPYADVKFKEQLGFQNLRKFLLTGLGDRYPTDLVLPLFNIAVGGDFSREANNTIHYAGPVVMGLGLLTDMSEEARDMFLDVLRDVLDMSYINKTRCCDFGLVDVLISSVETLFAEEKYKQVCDYLLQILSSLGKHSIAASELKRLLKLMNSTLVSQSREKLEKVIACMKEFQDRNGPDHFLNLLENHRA